MGKGLKYNKYDISLFVIIVSTIYGRYGLLHPTTFLSIWFLPQLLKNSYLFKYSIIKPFVSFFSFWIVYALVSFAWTPKVSDGFLGMTLLFVNSIIFLEIIVFAIKANRPVQIIANAWICAFLLTSIIALWEIGSGHHLPSARLESDAFVESRGDTYATVTFYNPNTYCYFMCLAFPYILYKLSKSIRRVDFLRNIGIILLLLFIMSRNSSRGGLLTLFIMISIFYIFKMKSSSYRKKILMFLGGGLVVILFILYGEVLFSTFFSRLSEKDVFEDNARLILWLSSWLGFVDSYGFGKGVGSMQTVLSYSTDNEISIVYSHNMILEILLEYGVLIAIGLFCFLFRLYKNSQNNGNLVIRSLIVGALLSFPFYSVINSENLNPSFIWIFFATLYVLSINNIIDNNVSNENTICDKRLSVGK